jgi:hypothetical protein
MQTPGSPARQPVLGRKWLLDGCKRLEGFLTNEHRSNSFNALTMRLGPENF